MCVGESQIVKKVGHYPKPRPANSYSIGPYAVMTSAALPGHPRWTEDATLKAVPKAIWDEFHTLQIIGPRYLPDIGSVVPIFDRAVIGARSGPDI